MNTSTEKMEVKALLVKKAALKLNKNAAVFLCDTLNLLDQFTSSFWENLKYKAMKALESRRLQMPLRLTF